MEACGGNDLLVLKILVPVDVKNTLNDEVPAKT